jgi:pre-mRNA-processing factor SLU7
MGGATRMSVRNLRIREDTAKFLFNLDPNSAHYDPKTRSLRSNPNPEKDPSQVTALHRLAIATCGRAVVITSFPRSNLLETTLSDSQANFAQPLSNSSIPEIKTIKMLIVHTGDVQEFANAQLYEIGAHEFNADVHMNALPTLTAKAHQQFTEKKNELESSQKSKLMQKYGGQEHMQPALSAAERMAVSEAYVEYGLDGSVIKGAAPAVTRSKYEEDVFRFHHTAVWGSFWREGQWGYSCCKSTVRNSYCLGKSASAAGSAMEDIMKGELSKLTAAKATPPPAPLKSSTGSLADDTRNSKRFNSSDVDVSVTDESMEEYRKGKMLASDPMAGYLDQEEGVSTKKQRKAH